MPRATRAPIPAEAIRDLLGLVRAMYAAGVEQGRDERYLDELRTAGLELVQALQLAEAPPGSMGHEAAWSKAERATERVGRAVRVTDSAKPVVALAIRRVRK